MCVYTCGEMTMIANVHVIIGTIMWCVHTLVYMFMGMCACVSA